MKPSTAQRLRFVLRVLLGLLFLWAALGKLANPTEFLGAIYAYQLPLSRGILKFAAVVLPWTELICGLMLLADFRTPTALVCTLGLILLFLAATGQAWARDLQISCGCFDLRFLGLGENRTGITEAIESVPFAFFRNLLLAAASLWILRNDPASK